MATEKHDPVTGQLTTGHEWNGIEELNTPVPRVVLFSLAAGTLFSIIYWILMPAWPLGWTYTKGLLGFDDRQVVMEKVENAALARSVWSDRLAAADFEELAADSALMRHVRETGRTLFADNCASCHGVNGMGGPGFPDLTAGAWLWGGDPAVLAETIRVGINSTHPETRVSQMISFGSMLDREKIRSAAAYVRSLSGQELSATEMARVEAGKEIFAASCASCHGVDAKGSRDLGAPDLTDSHWIYGGSAQAVFSTIHGGRQGHMPHWEGRLSPTDIKLLTLYIGTLAEDGQ